MSATPIDRSTDTHRVVDIDPHNPVHQAIVGNPGGSNVLIKDGRLHFPKPGVQHEETSAPAESKPEPKAEAPVKKAPVKKAAPKKEAPAKSETPIKTGMARNADKNKAKEAAMAKHNAAMKALASKKK